MSNKKLMRSILNLPMNTVQRFLPLSLIAKQTHFTPQTQAIAGQYSVVKQVSNNYLTITQQTTVMNITESRHLAGNFILLVKPMKIVKRNRI